MSCAKHGDVHFTPVRLDQLDLLGTWLSAPHNQEWWGDPDVELGYIRDMVEGRDTTRPFLFHVGGKPVGYIQYWFVGHHQNETWTKDHPWLLELPSETIGIDLSIGETDRLSKGIGSRALCAFVDWLVARGYRSIIIDPDPSNARAIRAYEKVGFRPVPHLLGKTHDTLIMQYELKQDELAP